MNEKKRIFNVAIVRAIDITEYCDKSNPFTRAEHWELPVCFTYFCILLEEYETKDGIKILRIATVLDDRAMDPELKSRNTVYDIPLSCVIEKRVVGELEI